MNLLKVVEALRIVIMADFKTVEKKFEQQGVEKERIEKYIDLFKKLRDQHKLKDDDKNIDNWGKKDFEEFEKFLDEKSEEKKHIRQLKEMEGAQLVAENDDWLVYNITDYEASKRYGEGTSWCITQEKWWNKYQRRKYQRRINFYFIISKKLDESNKWFKIAVQVPRKSDPVYWDATDRSHNDLPEELNVPEFKTEIKEPVGNMSKVDDLLDQMKSEFESEEAYYQTKEAYEYYEDYLTVNEMSNDWKDHLSGSSEGLLDQLAELLEVDYDDNTVKEIAIECSDTSLVGMYYANNEICSIGVGEQDPEVSDEIAEEIEELTDEERDELRELLSDNNVYMSNGLASYQCGNEYSRLVLILDEDKLEKYIKEETERRKVADKAIIEAIPKIKDKKVLLTICKNKNVGVRESAIKRLGELFKKDPELQEFFQKKATNTKENDKVRVAAVHNINSQSFLKNLVTRTKNWNVQSVAFYKIKDKAFLKKYGLKIPNLHSHAIELINDVEYTKKMLTVKNPPYERIIEFLPTSEQESLVNIVARKPENDHWYTKQYKEKAIEKITDQKALFRLFELGLPHDLNEKILTRFNQNNLEKVYDNLTEEEREKYNFITAAKKRFVS